MRPRPNRHYAWVATHHASADRGFRVGLWVVAVVSLMVVAMATFIVVGGWYGQQRVNDCRRDEVPGSESWSACSTRSSWFG
jgi:hypothetical protein